MSYDPLKEMIRVFVDSSITTATMPMHTMADQLDEMAAHLRFMRISGGKCTACEESDPYQCKIYIKLETCKRIKE